MTWILTATNNTLNAHIADRYEDSPWFCIYHPLSGAYEFIENNRTKTRGKLFEINTHFLTSETIQIAIAHRFGSKCMELFRTENIQMVIPDKAITLTEIIKRIK